MSETYIGRCPCGAVQLSLSLPRPLMDYAPRACDCDFCTARALGYLSDPEGALQITTDNPLQPLVQGAGIAEFLSCPDCDAVAAVQSCFSGVFKGAVNAGLLERLAELQPALVVSPKLLAPAEKRIRWLKGWMPVQIKLNASA